MPILDNKRYEEYSNHAMSEILLRDKTGLFRQIWQDIASKKIEDWPVYQDSFVLIEDIPVFRRALEHYYNGRTSEPLFQEIIFKVIAKKIDLTSDPLTFKESLEIQREKK